MNSRAIHLIGFVFAAFTFCMPSHAQSQASRLEDVLNEVLTSNLDPLQPGGTSYSQAYVKLTEAASKAELRAALRKVLLDHSRIDQWYEAQRFYQDAEVNDPEYEDDGFLLEWSRRAYREDRLVEGSHERLLRVAFRHLRTRGTIEDAHVFRDAANSLSSHHDTQKKALLKIAEEFPQLIRERDAEWAKLGIPGFLKKKRQPPADNAASDPANAEAHDPNAAWFNAYYACVMVIGLAAAVWLTSRRSTRSS